MTLKRLSLAFPWSVLFFLTTSFAYLYSFMEWIFFVTKPSFMSGMSIWMQLRIYLLSALGISLKPLLLLLLLAALSRIFNNKPITQILIAIGTAIPSLIFSSLVLILADNFTYTVLKFGVVSTERIPRAIYGLLFLVLFGYVFYKINAYVQVRGRKKFPVKQNQWLPILGLLSLSVLLSLFSILTDRTSNLSSDEFAQIKSSPNIILLGSDGLDANHLSAYGYERDTTPHIHSLLSNALLAENAFPNGGPLVQLPRS